MGIQPRDARELTLWEYEAILVNWNSMHNTDPDPEAATTDQFHLTEQFFDEHPELLN